jgi:tetratricopeptide (TPR) repeat protein
VRSIFTLCVLVSAGALCACAHRERVEPYRFSIVSDAEQPAEAVSLLGEPLRRQLLRPDVRERLEANLAEAQRAFDADPNDEDAIIWLGRRLAYLGRHNDAVEVFTRHRGHRYITLRKFDDAIADLSRASMLVRDIPDELEPDGAPNPMGVPVSTTNSNIEYHLALAHFLKGDFSAAIEAYKRCWAYSQNNDDQRVSTGDWYYRTLRRLGRSGEAREFLDSFLKDDMEIIENHAYHAMLLWYAGRAPAPQTQGDTLDAATTGFAVANELLADGKTAEARELLERIVASDAPWGAFGYIAAEAELARMRTP